MMQVDKKGNLIQLGFYTILYITAVPYHMIRLHEAIDRMAGRRGR